MSEPGLVVERFNDRGWLAGVIASGDMMQAVERPRLAPHK
jgi:hypothetical protein